MQTGGAGDSLLFCCQREYPGTTTCQQSDTSGLERYAKKTPPKQGSRNFTMT